MPVITSFSTVLAKILFAVAKTQPIIIYLFIYFIIIIISIIIYLFLEIFKKILITLGKYNPEGVQKLNYYYYYYYAADNSPG